MCDPLQRKRIFEKLASLNNDDFKFVCKKDQIPPCFKPMDNIKNIREAVESYEDYQIAALLRENLGKSDEQSLIGKR